MFLLLLLLLWPQRARFCATSNSRKRRSHFLINPHLEDLGCIYHVIISLLLILLVCIFDIDCFIKPLMLVGMMSRVGVFYPAVAPGS